jgi:hypothetical protein
LRVSLGRTVSIFTVAFLCTERASFRLSYNIDLNNAARAIRRGGHESNRFHSRKSGITITNWRD